jgi:cytochrome c oxidase assembly protein subunit 15
MSKLADNTTSPWPHRWAVVLCCATFPLVWVGALVTTYKAGMAVPDWPTSYGYNMFAYPWEWWVFGPYDIFMEHGHRLLGSLVGMLTIAFLASTLLTKAPRSVRWLAVAALALVIFQGVLGGMRVLLDERLLAMLHGCTGPAFFALTAVLALVTSQRWQASTETPIDRATVVAGIATPVLAYVQIVFGALLRHVPNDAGPSWFRIAVIFHVFTALVIAGHVLGFGIKTLRKQTNRWITSPTTALVVLVGLQLVLGASTWVLKYSWPSALSQYEFAAGYTVTANSLAQALVTTAHVAVGSLILAVSTVLAVRLCRLAECRLSLRESSVPVKSSEATFAERKATMLRGLAL